jgi:hypothetical protein
MYSLYCNKNLGYYLKQHLTTLVTHDAVNLLCEKLFRMKGTGFIKAILRAGKKFRLVLLFRKQVNCSLPALVSTFPIITFKLFRFFVQIPDHGPDVRDER